MRLKQRVLSREEVYKKFQVVAVENKNPVAARNVMLSIIADARDNAPEHFVMVPTSTG
jgi:hypothetical protein